MCIYIHIQCIYIFTYLHLGNSKTLLYPMVVESLNIKHASSKKKQPLCLVRLDFQAIHQLRLAAFLHSRVV